MVPTMAAVSSLLSLLSLLAPLVTAGTHDAIMANLQGTFMTSYTDFIDAKKNDLFFPLSQAMEQNRVSQRPDYSTISASTFGEDTSAYLATWRGFPRIDELTAARDLDLLLNSSSSFASDFLAGSMTRSEIEELPLAWQYLLPHVFYDSLSLPGGAWAEIVNRQPLNAALLYKVALLLRDEEDSVKDRFVHGLKIPKMFREDLGYILGYRWGIAASTSSSTSADDFNLRTLLHLPADRVMAISTDLYNRMNVPDLLADWEEWRAASVQAKVVWFTKFVAESGWEGVVGAPPLPRDLALRRLGHLLAGAPLNRLASIAETPEPRSHAEEVRGSGVASVLNHTDMNPLRVQELWEAVPAPERRYLFPTHGAALDSAQLLHAYSTSFAYLHSLKPLLDASWVPDSATPWSSLLVVAAKERDSDPIATWGERQLLDIGAFLATIYPPQLEELRTASLTSGVLDKVLSPLLTHCQRTVLYGKFLETGSRAVPPLLLAAVPATTLLQLGSATSPLAVAWASHKEELLRAAELFTPAQMVALHELSRPVLWEAPSLSSILAIHPECLADVTPKEFRANLGSVVEALYLAGPEMFHSIAESVQRLPRHLLMAWLEAVLELEGSTRGQGGWWSSDVLLDRNIAEQVEPDGDMAPGPLRSQLARFKSTSLTRSSLPSLALAGISCHCIAKVETPDSLEVLGLFRYHVESSGRRLTHMSSMARRCWARKVRDYLLMKAGLFGVEVASEPELLSVLSTSDIKAIGGEVLLTWGGAALAGITHPQVQHEVLMTVAHNPPHFLLHNGVTLADVELLSRTLLDSLLSHFDGNVTLPVLTHLHNLLPFADDRILGARPEDMRLYVRSVLRETCKAVCIPTRARLRLRSFLLAAFGEPRTWSALDLAEMGNLLVVFRRSDLLEVAPTALRRAAASLVASSLYTEELGDIRGRVGETPYHEACAAWLGPREGAEFTKAWRALAELHVLANHLQVALVEHNVGTVSRRRRQAVEDSDPDDEVAVEIKKIYVDVMNDMKKKFDNGDMSSDQKVAATTVITETQTLLGVKSFEVLGLEVGVKNSAEVFAVLKEYKESGNMTEEQNTAMQDLAEDTQIRMIQGILGVFGYTSARAAAEYGVPEAEMAELLARPSFGTDPAAVIASDAAIADIIATTTTKTTVTTTTATTTATSTAATTTTTVESLDTSAPVGLTTLLASTTEAVAVAAAPAPAAGRSVFRQYEPQEDPQFLALPGLDSGAARLGCDCLRASGRSVAGLSARHIALMEPEQVSLCLDTLGKVPWPAASRAEVWAAVLAKVPELGASGGSAATLGRKELMLLDTLLPAVAESHPHLINLARDSLDGISLLGRHPLPSSAATSLVRRFLETNSVTSLTVTEAASLGSLLCGLSEEQWRNLITSDIFPSILADHLSRLDCAVTEGVKSHLAGLLLQEFGPTDTWTASDLYSTGWLASTLSPSSLSSLMAHGMEGVSGRALRHLTAPRLLALAPEQLMGLSPHAASFIRREQLLPYAPQAVRRAVRAAGGEAPEVHAVMEALEPAMAAMDPADQAEDRADQVVGSGAGLPIAGVLVTMVALQLVV